MDNSESSVIDENMDRIVEWLAQRFARYFGELPPYPAIFAEALIRCVPCVREAPQEQQQEFVDEFYRAFWRFVGSESKGQWPLESGLAD